IPGKSSGFEPAHLRYIVSQCRFSGGYPAEEGQHQVILLDDVIHGADPVDLDFNRQFFPCFTDGRIPRCFARIALAAMKIPLAVFLPATQQHARLVIKDDGERAVAGHEGRRLPAVGGKTDAGISPAASRTLMTWTPFEQGAAAASSALRSKSPQG